MKIIWTKADNLKFVWIWCVSWKCRLHSCALTGIQLCRCLHPKCELLSWEIECRKHFQHRLANTWHRIRLKNISVFVCVCWFSFAKARKKVWGITRIQRRAKVLLYSFQNDFCSHFPVFSHTMFIRSLVAFFPQFSTCYYLSYVSNLTTSKNNE